MPSKKKSTFHCGFYDSGVLKRHVTKTHPSCKAQQSSESSDCLRSDLVPLAEMELEPLILKGFFETNVWKLAQNGCYLDVT